MNVSINLDMPTPPKTYTEEELEAELKKRELERENRAIAESITDDWAIEQPTIGKGFHPASPQLWSFLAAARALTPGATEDIKEVCSCNYFTSLCLLLI